MRKRGKKADYKDDGRVIAPMNVAGMPWYSPRREYGANDSGSVVGDREQTDGSVVHTAAPGLDRREKAAFMSGVLKASLLAALVYIAALAAFILFCTEIWFRQR